MKKWFAPDLRYLGTIIVHWFLLSVARSTLYDYPDVILWVGGLLLTTHLIWSICLVRKGTPPMPIAISVVICTILQILTLNRITDLTGFGSELALLFYEIMLAVFLILMLVCLPIAYCTRRKPQ